MLKRPRFGERALRVVGQLDAAGQPRGGRGAAAAATGLPSAVLAGSDGATYRVENKDGKPLVMTTIGAGQQQIILAPGWKLLLQQPTDASVRQLHIDSLQPLT
jgi:hypothetical protein